MNQSEPVLKGIDDGLLRLIGVVTVEWGLLEQVLHRCLWAAAGLAEEAVEPRHVIRSSDAAWQLLRREIARKFLGLLAQAQAVEATIDAVADRRNRLVHGVWVPNDPVGLRWEGRAETSGADEHEMSVADLEDLASSIAEARAQLSGLLRQLLEADGGDDTDGGAGVREPRRPLPTGGAEGVALPAPANAPPQRNWPQR